MGAVNGLPRCRSAPALSASRTCSGRALAVSMIDRRAGAAVLRFPAADLAHGGQPVHDRHLHVHQHHVEARRARRRRPPGGRPRRCAAPPGAAQHQLDDLAVGRMVVGEQDPQAVAGRGLDRVLAGGGRSRRWRPAGATSIQKVEPAPGLLSQSSEPPISSASSLEMARPRPVPPNRRVIELSACWKRPSTRGLSAGWKPTPVSETSKRAQPGRRLLDLQRDRAALGELDRVAEQVGQHLAHAHLVAQDEAVQRLGHRDLQAARPSRRSAAGTGRRPTFTVSPRWNGRLLDGQPAGLDAGQVEDVGQQPLERVARRADDLDHLALPAA